MAEKLKLMLADHNTDYRNQLANIFVESGKFDVIASVGDGASALTFLGAVNPDILLLDLVMPKMDGIEVLQQIRQRNLCPQGIRIFANSSIYDASIVEYSQRLGVLYFFAKPMDAGIVLERVIGLLNLSDHATKSSNEKSAYARRNTNLEELITKYLLLLGIPAHVSGYRYLRSSILYYANRKYGLSPGVTTEIYPAVAEEYSSTSIRVERAIRHAIELAWNNGNNINVQHKFFGYTVNDKRGRPTNREFIAMIADRAIMNLRHDAS